MVRLIPDSEPAPTISGESESRDRWIIDQPLSDEWENRPRSGDDPAPTLREHTRQWVFVNGNQENAARRPSSAPAPAPTVHFASAINDVKWVTERPATTLTGDERCFGPHSGSKGESHSKNAVRVSIQEAAVLQSFRADYPWHGSRTAVFTQIGNAVPPLLGRAVITALLATRKTEAA